MRKIFCRILLLGVLASTAGCGWFKATKGDSTSSNDSESANGGSTSNGNADVQCPKGYSEQAIVSWSKGKPVYTCVVTDRKRIQPQEMNTLDEVFTGLLARCAAAEAEMQERAKDLKVAGWVTFVIGTASTLTAAALTGINNSNSPDFVKVRNTAIGLGVGGSLFSAISGGGLFGERANASASALGRVRAAMDGARAEWLVVRHDLVEAQRVLRSMASACSETLSPEIIQTALLSEKTKKLKSLDAVKLAAIDAGKSLEPVAKAMPGFVAPVVELDQLEKLLDSILRDDWDPRIKVAAEEAITQIGAFKKSKSSDDAIRLQGVLQHFQKVAGAYSLF
jgi:hypothetical protein